MIKFKDLKISHVLTIAMGGIFSLFALLTIALVWQSMREQSLEEAKEKAKLLLDRNLATHSYFTHVLKPNLFKWTEPIRSENYFDPSWMSSTYAVRQIHKYFSALNPEGYYAKDAAINARSPDNEADDVEKAFFKRLQADDKLELHSEIRSISGKPYLTVMRKGEVLEESCVRCHTTPSVAPQQLLDRYGTERSFGRNVGDQISVISMQIPLSAAYAGGNRAALHLSAVLALGLASLFAVQIFLYRRLLLSPLRLIRDRALGIAGDNKRLGESIQSPMGKEFGELTDAFNQMSYKLKLNMEQLEDRVAQRTKELSASNADLQREISERKKVEEALRLREERFQMLFDRASDGISILTPAGKLIAINESFARMHGYTKEELLTLNIRDLDTPESKRLLPERAQRVLAGESITFEVEHYHKDGHTFPLEVSSSLIVSGKEHLIQAFHRDITERKQAVEALRRSESVFRSYFDQPMIGIAITSPDKGCIEVNPRLCEMLGYPKEEIILLTWEHMTHPDDLASDVAQFKRVLQGEIESYALDKRLVRKDGTTINVAMSVSCVRMSDGSVDYFIALIQDITARVLMEARTRELQKMEALGTLAGGVAHDFNNILAIIMGNLQLARADVGPTHPALESLAEIDKASHRARNLVQQILAFGRRQTTERRFVSLAPATREAAKFLRATIPSGINLSVECAPETPAVLADETQIEQVLINLGSNAWHAIEALGKAGTIEIRLQPEVREGRQFAVLTVRDNGCGMDDATRMRVFEPFFTTKPVGKGTGLGLAVVYGIVQSHGASIEVQSALGEGTAFVILFPAAEPPGARVDGDGVSTGKNAAAEDPALEAAGKRILYLDDEASIVSLMKRLLGRRGYWVTGYSEPHEAIEVVRRDPAQFDIVITDHNMPGMSGLQVARALREIRADLPVILISGYISEELQRDAPAAGARELIFKASTLDEMCEAVERCSSELNADRKDS